jgi:peptidoglycan/xylan/chitin deacetylase (PgdA/CDA1 family)
MRMPRRTQSSSIILRREAGQKAFGQVQIIKGMWQVNLATCLLVGCALLTVLLAACSPAGQPAALAGSPTPNLALTEAFQKALDQATRSIPTPTATVTPTPVPPTLTPTATPIRTPPALPGLFTTDILTKDVLPQTYIQDTCEYLKARWDPNNSSPGTVVMIIMYHSVAKDFRTLEADGSGVHNSDVVMTLKHAKEVGFQTINATQLADFLDHNAKIPRRSLLIIVDDRKRKEFYEANFFPQLKEYGWTMTNAWISAKDTPDYLWKENEEVVATGLVDPQSHGVIHNININEGSSDDFIRGELQGSIDAIKQHFGKTPVGFIWPGGGFTQHAIQLAREIGYRVGFTTNPRGPVMFNWVPQAEKKDDNHTDWLPEIPAKDPRMTLPRYWSIDAAYRIDDVIQINKQAEAAAASSKSTELEYYDIVCKSETGEIPTAAK